jgi:peptide/nickel transport system ATP-binding protein
MFHGQNLLTSDRLSRPGWDKISLVPQAAMNCFNPCQKINNCLAETLNLAGPLSIEKQYDRVHELLDLVHLPHQVLKMYPHELSGGMKQRVAIVLAMLLKPELIIFDEATTGLDVLVEADILKSIRALMKVSKLSLLFVSHDQRVTKAFCHSVVTLT